MWAATTWEHAGLSQGVHACNLPKKAICLKVFQIILTQIYNDDEFCRGVAHGGRIEVASTGIFHMQRKKLYEGISTITVKFHVDGIRYQARFLR